MPAPNSNQPRYECERCRCRWDEPECDGDGLDGICPDCGGRTYPDEDAEVERLADAIEDRIGIRRPGLGHVGETADLLGGEAR